MAIVSLRSKIKIKETLIRLLWPKFLWPQYRSACKQKIRRISVDQRMSDMASKSADDEKISPWAFIRVKNERPTLEASLNSILPVINKGVIAYNECTDGSDKIIEQFCKENPGFIPYHYPYSVEPAGSKKYEEGTVPYENSLAGYYNSVLELIPKNEWIIKIDGDLITFPKILEHSFYLPKSPKDFVIYSRLNVIRLGSELKVINYVRPGDCWLIFNDNLHFENVFGYEKTIDGKDQFYSWETLKITNRNIPFVPECSSIHFPFEKNYRSFKDNIEELQNFDDYMKQANRSEISDELLQIKDIIKTFEC